FENLHEVVFVASYLCKADSKLITKGRHPFSTSSRKAFPNAPKASPKAEIMPFIDKVKPSQAEEAKYDAFQAKGVRIPGHGSLLLDDIEAKYLEQDISDVWDYLAKKIEVSPDFVAVRFTLEIDDGFLRLRKRFEYFEKYYLRLEATMRYKLGHEGKTKSTDISHLKAFNTVQKEGRQYLMHGVLLIEGKVFDQVFESDDDNYLHAYLAEEATYTYGLGISEAEQRLEIKSVHRLNSRHARFESISHSLHQHIAELCFAERSASMGSTLYLR
ncbi:MAG: hypothetical protein IBX55_21685, partial [Methyloprofundus sp.]|nr:hypothetical protein [Methyloprofundus sp.]